MNRLKNLFNPGYRLLELSGCFALFQRLGGATLRCYRELIRGNIGDVSGQHVLDIGCGIGNFRPDFAGDYTGIDINPAYIEKARQAFSGTFLEMDGSKLSFADSTFDQVVSIATLHHVDDATVKETVAEALRVCKPGGAVHIVDAILPTRPNPLKTLIFRMDRGDHPRKLEHHLAAISAAAPIEGHQVLTGPVHDTVYVRIRKGAQVVEMERKMTIIPNTLAKALAVAAFIVYALTIFSIPQIRDSRNCCEQHSFSAALSHFQYGTPLGAMFMDVPDVFMKYFKYPMADSLDKIQEELPRQPSGRYSETTLDGNGAGYPVLLTAAFTVFGVKWWAMIASMLIMMGVSLLIFIRRFPPLLATLYFCGLTFMLFNVLVWDPRWSVQIQVGSIRYFSLVGLLPLFYILLSLMDGDGPRDTWGLAAQGAILMLAALVRGNAAIAYAAIILVALILMMWRRNGSATFRKVVTVGVASAGVVIIFANMLSPQWFESGRFSTIVWTRITQGLGVDPNISAAELNKLFPCEKHVPSGIPDGIGDTGGACMFFAYADEKGIPPEDFWNMTYGGEFDTALRIAFFKILKAFPLEVLKAIFIYKPPTIVQSIAISYPIKISPYPVVCAVLLFVSMTIAVVSGILARSRWRETLVVAITAAFMTLAYLATYANPGVTIDLLFCCVAATGLAAGFLGHMALTLNRARNAPHADGFRQKQ